LPSKNIKNGIHRTVILPVVLYGCENQSLISREENGLKLFQSRVLRRLFGAKREEMKGKWRRIHTEKLNDLYRSQDSIRELRSRLATRSEHVARIGDRKKFMKISEEN
jgi:hypothetical protein